jgi:hypothetical protein
MQTGRTSTGQGIKKAPLKRGAPCAGSETRTRTTVKLQVFETSASTIPPFPRTLLLNRNSKSGCKCREVFSNPQQIFLFQQIIFHHLQMLLLITLI